MIQYLNIWVYNSQPPTPFHIQKTGAELGSELSSTADDIERRYIDNVSMLKDKAEQEATTQGIQGAPVGRLTQQLQRVLKERGIAFEPLSGEAILPGTQVKGKLAASAERGGAQEFITDPLTGQKTAVPRERVSVEIPTSKTISGGIC